MVASWSCEGLPAEVKQHNGLRLKAQQLASRVKADPSFIGWTMVTILSEVWRYRIASAAAGQRLLLLPDCPLVQEPARDNKCPSVCGPSCGLGTIWSAAHDNGWVVDSTRSAATAIGSLLSGQYQGILGVARLKDLEKAYGMLPAFSFPVAAVPYQHLEASEAKGARATKLFSMQASMSSGSSVCLGLLAAHLDPSVTIYHSRSFRIIF